MMKSLLSITLTLLISACAYGQGIEFVDATWQDALEMAKKENKLLFVDAYAKWCGPCKKMAKHEFVKDEVGTVYNSNFINLKLDMETPNGRTFDSKYPVSAYPTMFFLSGEGEVVKKIRGGKKAPQLVEMAKKAMKSHDTSGDWQAKYDEGDRSYETMYNLVAALNKVEKPSLKISNDYIYSKPEISDKELADFLLIAVVNADSRLFEMLIEKKDLLDDDDQELYNKKVSTALKSTVRKSIDYESPDLLSEAILNAEKALGKKEAKIFEYEAHTEYAHALRNQDDFLKYAKKLHKAAIKDQPEVSENLVKTILRYYPKDEKMLELASDIAKDYYKAKPSDGSVGMYAKTLTLMNDFDKAIKVIEKQLKINEKEGAKTNQLENMIEVIKARKQKTE